MAASTSHEMCVVPQVVMISEDDGAILACSDEDLPLQSSQRIFYEKLIEYDDQHQGAQRKAWTQERIFEVINEINTARETMNAGHRRTPMDYYWMSKYDVMKTSSEYYLIFKRQNPSSESAVRIVPREIYFDILSEIHTSSGHIGRDKMLHDLKNKYYVPKKAVEIFVSLCPTCETKKKFSKKGNVSRLTKTRDLNMSGQVDMIDFESCPDGEYKWVLIYQEDASKFSNLRPLKSDRPSEVATELMNIFLSFGAPYKLQSDNVEFTAKLVEELVTMCPDFKIVCERPRQLDSQGRQDIESLLRSWMKENSSTNWSKGIYFVQFNRNVSIHSVIGRSPYRALFGSDPNTKFSASDVPTTSATDGEEMLDPLRESVSESPVGAKCSCKPATHQCHNNRCACFKKKVPCGSQCHGSFSCINK